MTQGSSVVASYRYDPYGALTHMGGSDAALAARNPIRYRSYYYDAETGLYYLPARYYDPDTMRFLSADPASPRAGDPLSLNRYVYCVGDPVDGDDPTGAVIEIDGDGRLDAEASQTQHYTSLPSGPSGSRAGARKYAAHSAMVAATRAAVAGLNARAVSNLARLEFDAAFDYYSETGGLVPPRVDATRYWDWSLTPARDDPVGYGISTVGAACDFVTVLTAAACPPVATGAVGFGLVAAGAELAHTRRCYLDGRATDMDMVMATVGVVPLLGLYKPLKGLGLGAAAVTSFEYGLDTLDWFE